MISDMTERLKGPTVARVLCTLQDHENGYWENVMYLQFTLHAASNLICTSIGKHLLTAEMVSFSLLQFRTDRCAGKLK